ncbi:hypothetical protein [Rhizobium phage RHEph16]|uniref:Uncharacterized protein n=1 Tax=Rhizobium phage RHEph16 TaxID=2836132 RepID=A0AAE7VMI7_9CAUD|nr:hypothetical protein PP750_gp15 [Rhizobium phage RHEph16]QXV74324.1 hypothetical protein [Rhizobium phage RHEph16]
MKVTIEFELPDKIVEHDKIARRIAEQAMHGTEHALYRYCEQIPIIQAKWEFKKFSGVINNERNPS